MPSVDTHGYPLKADGLSPMQWLMKRGPRTTVPGSPEPAANATERRAAFSRRLVGREKKRQRIDAFAREGKPLTVGLRVRLRNPSTGVWDSIGEVTELMSNGRSARIQVGNRTTRRNRRHLRPIQDIDTDIGSDYGRSDNRQDDSPGPSDHGPPPYLRPSGRRCKQPQRLGMRG